MDENNDIINLLQEVFNIEILYQYYCFQVKMNEYKV